MEPKGETMLEGVRMAMGALDCPICYEPLSCLRFTRTPPEELELKPVRSPAKHTLTKCGVGHLVCNSCCIRLNKCPLCPRSAFERCFGMERVVVSVEVPCCFAENGCTKKIAYFNKKKHEKACRHGPCFCPEPGCGFSGPAATLTVHVTDSHKWPSTAFKYYAPFGLLLRPGPHVLRAQDGAAFLMNVVAAEPLGHAISLVCVQPEATDSPFGCSLVFSCFTGHHQISTLAAVRYSTLADGLPNDAFCVVPKASGGTHVLLQTTIDTELVYDVEGELEEEDDEDESYDEEDDSDDDEEEDDSDDDQEDSDGLPHVGALI